ncbi:hypothetical protein SMICM17S_10702 [Streptomyces microflavus]
MLAGALIPVRGAGQDPTRLGREAPDCAHVPGLAALDQVFRAHAELYWHAGRLYVADTDSVNGTYVDGLRISRPAQLWPGGHRLRLADDPEGVDVTVVELDEYGAPLSADHPHRARRTLPSRQEQPGTEPGNEPFEDPHGRQRDRRTGERRPTAEQTPEPSDAQAGLPAHAGEPAYARAPQAATPPSSPTRKQTPDPTPDAAPPSPASPASGADSVSQGDPVPLPRQDSVSRATRFRYRARTPYPRATRFRYRARTPRPRVRPPAAAVQDGQEGRRRTAAQSSHPPPARPGADALGRFPAQ